MASDHEIEVLKGLIAAMTSHAAVVRSSAGDEDARRHELRALNGRIQGLEAQIVALGGGVNSAAIDNVGGAAIVRNPPGRGEAGAAAPTRVALAIAFQSALEDGRIGASTRAAINTAWSFLEAAFCDATSPDNAAMTT
ncbi:hypothetical protein HZF05_10090 [Sphingomonas sp. CGMCC 1.13654]|uniref:Uncharacterized protein n=1 Tax=Sphingomonas chungangi TaxID=2683589 RepID=A0A838L8I0_9SPHN|nr:hypothetical protein [Sphingomonas chungangi]MBA2934446.1 hypothetical protein [Sphingomonas chungangi]MVW57485.1 hypothetical protein [Sphingomonas chungangi]